MIDFQALYLDTIHHGEVTGFCLYSTKISILGICNGKLDECHPEGFIIHPTGPHINHPAQVA